MKIQIHEIPWIAPFSVFEKIRHLPYAVFLDSSLNNKLGRYSIISVNPFALLKSKGGKTFLAEKEKTRIIDNNPFDTLKSLLNKYQLSISDFPLPFLGGTIGYFSYDLLHHLEKISTQQKNDLNLPDCILGFYDSGLVFDHFLKKVFLLYTKEKITNLDFWKRIIKNPPQKITRGEKIDNTKLISNFSKQNYLRAIMKTKTLIKNGDIYQVNLSQRFETAFSNDPWDTYLRLRKASPNPFGGFLNFKDFQLLSSSPERFLSLNNGFVSTRPMKGTRARGNNPTEDKMLKKDLVHSPKDAAELLMITDLLRNDLGKVCEYGSIKVKKLRNLEEYLNVFQATALIEGRLHHAKNRIDLIKACFPGGSVTGAPKIRSMQIISELEPTTRGPYTGALGYLSFCGKMDLNIIIRSIVIKNSKAYFQVGGGIVADSDPEKEYEETLTKAKAMIQALSNGN